jgi:hypothetical protein
LQWSVNEFPKIAICRVKQPLGPAHSTVVPLVTIATTIGAANAMMRQIILIPVQTHEILDCASDARFPMSLQFRQLDHNVCLECFLAQ